MHLDLVSFPRPVCVQEVRVIPAGHRVHAAVSEREKMGYVRSRQLDSLVASLASDICNIFLFVNSLTINKPSQVAHQAGGFISGFHSMM